LGDLAEPLVARGELLDDHLLDLGADDEREVLALLLGDATEAHPARLDLLAPTGDCETEARKYLVMNGALDLARLELERHRRQRRRRQQQQRRRGARDDLLEARPEALL